MVKIRNRDALHWRGIMEKVFTLINYKVSRKGFELLYFFFAGFAALREKNNNNLTPVLQ